MKLEELFESDLSDRRKLGMFAAHERIIEDILTKYAQGRLSPSEARSEMRKLGYDAYPDMRSAWKHNRMQLIDIKTKSLFTISI